MVTCSQGCRTGDRDTCCHLGALLSKWAKKNLIRLCGVNLSPSSTMQHLQLNPEEAKSGSHAEATIERVSGTRRFQLRVSNSVSPFVLKAAKVNIAATERVHAWAEFPNKFATLAALKREIFGKVDKAGGGVPVLRQMRPELPDLHSGPIALPVNNLFEPPLKGSLGLLPFFVLCRFSLRCIYPQ